jgi:HD-like signal output (HDOD) protein
MNLASPMAERTPAQSPAGPTGGPEERRRDPRTPFDGEATIIPCTIGAKRLPLVVRVRDVSRSGIGITHTAPMALGERFIAVLPPAIAGIPRGVLCTVVRSAPLPGGGFLIGAAFSGVVSAGGPVRPATSAGSTPQPITEKASPGPAAEAAPSTNAPAIATAPAHVAAGHAKGNVPAQAVPPAPPRAAGEVCRLLTRDECVHRAESAMQARTLSGVVAQVISQAASPRSDMGELASLVARDPMLSARILQAANSVSYASTRGMVSTVAEAVRNIGCATVRDIAASLGVFDAMPACSGDGFNPIRCWQHSFAVATLCQRLAGDALSGAAYLIGLCHDLGEILFHTHFGAEYSQVLAAQAETGRRRDDVERKMLGMSHGELVVTILRCLGLPDTIRAPIEAFHKAGISSRGTTDVPTRLLRIAELYANGMLLASSPQSPLAPLTRAECRAVARDDEPARPDGIPLRTEIFALTAMLARMSAKDEAELMAPLYPHREVSLWLARDPFFSSFDPIAAALEAMANVTVQPRLPTADEAAQLDGLVVVSRNAGTGGLSALETARAAALRPNVPLPVLWLTGSIDGMAAGLPGGITPCLWPVPLGSIAEFVTGL